MRQTEADRRGLRAWDEAEKARARNAPEWTEADQKRLDFLIREANTGRGMGQSPIRRINYV